MSRWNYSALPLLCSSFLFPDFSFLAFFWWGGSDALFTFSFILSNLNLQTSKEIIYNISYFIRFLCYFIGIYFQILLKQTFCYMNVQITPFHLVSSELLHDPKIYIVHPILYISNRLCWCMQYIFVYESGNTSV